MTFRDFLVILLLVIAIVLFFWGILSAVHWTKEGKPEAMPNFLCEVVTTLCGVLVTNLGEVNALFSNSCNF